MRLLLRLSLALLCWLSLAQAAGAVAPGHRWRTMESPHFVLHFHEGLYPLAHRALALLEHAHERLVPFLGAEPWRKTQVVLSDDTDEANGMATAYPRPEIQLFASPPGDLSELGDYDDFLHILTTHEYAHVLHIGTMSGLPLLLSRTIGLIVVPNGLQPRFVTEGLAVYQESHHSAGGRLRSALFDMILRADALENSMLGLDQITNGPLRWPRGSAWYLYGGKLMQHLAETRGDEALLRYSHSYGANLIPFGINLELREAAGVDWVELWEEWTKAVRARAKAQAEAIAAAGPLTEATWRSHFGGRTGSPRWSPDGRGLFYIEASEDRRPHVRRYDLETGRDRALRELGAGGNLAPLPDGQRVLVARREIFRSYWSFDDLFRVGPGEERRLTHGLRASEPDVSRDGSFAVFVRRGAGRTRLSRISLDAIEAGDTVFYEPPAGRQVYTPRISPDGRWVAFSQTRSNGGRDILLVRPDGSGLRRITDDAALDLQPAWTPDGRRLLFSSDRNGVFEIHEIDLESGSMQRLTNQLTGAFQPDVSPDGKWLAWTTYGPRGYDVAVAPFPAAGLYPVVTQVAARQDAGLPAAGEEPVYPVRPYNPLETLGPQTWLPYVAVDVEGTLLGLSTVASDVVGLHHWELSAGIGINSWQMQGAASYRYEGWPVRPQLGVGTTYRGVPGFAQGVTERATSGRFELSYPWGTMRSSQSVSLGYQATWLQPVRLVQGQLAPEAGLATELQLGWGLASYERPPESISPEAGFATSIFGRLGSQALGGAFEYRSIDMRAEIYLRMPWHPHHVLALSGLSGLGAGDLGERRLFSLGGPLLRDPLIDALYTGRVLADVVLRGYEPGAFTGRHVAVAGAEYRFPIAWLDRGIDTLPIWAGKLAGVVFFEGGDAFNRLEAARFHPSLGAELRLSFQLGWGLPGSLRLGNAWGFDLNEGGGYHAYMGLGTVF